MRSAKTNSTNMTQHSNSFLEVQTAFKEILEKLTKLSSTDLSEIHIGHEWSWMPYVKDHLTFLIEQVEGLTESLQDTKPPETLTEIKALKETKIDSTDSNTIE